MTTLGSIGERLDLILRKGASFGPHRVELANEDGSPVNLTGQTIRAVIRLGSLDGDIFKTFSVAVADAANGFFDFDLSDEQSADLVVSEKLGSASEKYVFDLVLIDSVGRVIPIFYGDCEVF